jgi:hypothetical protein
VLLNGVVVSLRHPLFNSGFPEDLRGKLLLWRVCSVVQSSFLIHYGRDGSEAEHGSRAKCDLALGCDGH